MGVIGFNGGIVGPDNTPTTSVASGVWTLDELFAARDLNIWPTEFVPIQATGGTVQDVTISGVLYRIHTFTTVGSSSFVVTDTGSLGEVEYLVVAGGGGGGVGSGGNAAGGAGGAGGLIFSEILLNVGTSPVVVGAGAASLTATNNNQAQSGNIGENSSAFGDVAIRGGPGGVGYGNNPSAGRFNGGSGGGEAPGNQTYRGPGQGTSGQGNDGGDITSSANNYGGGGGGGGAGFAGQDGITSGSASSANAGGDGGDGLFFGDKFGTSLGDNGFFAGGGGGGQAAAGPSSFAVGGAGGGGRGSNSGNATGRDGTEDGLPNTGGGGGGGGTRGASNVGGAGGSGIVIIRYPLEAT